jgi:hypothetical protein
MEIGNLSDEQKELLRDAAKAIETSIWYVALRNMHDGREALAGFTTMVSGQKALNTLAKLSKLFPDIGICAAFSEEIRNRQHHD